MSDGDSESDATLFPRRPGDQLRDARLAQNLDLADIAQRTRIPQRHLESIETSNYAGLPSITYAIGFAKAYARTVGLDEVKLASEVRSEISSDWSRPAPAPVYQVEDRSRTPSGGLVWGGVLVAVLVLVGVGLWYGTNLFRSGAAPTSLALPSGDVAVPIPDPSPAIDTGAPAGQVVITATDEVWVRVYDAADTTLMIKTMMPGERYEVPPDANNPVIDVGRPDKLSVTVNGSAVPPLGDGRVAIDGVGISAAALLARNRPAVPTATPSPTASPSPRASATPRSSPTPRPSPSAMRTPAPRRTDPVISAPPPAVVGNTIY